MFLRCRPRQPYFAALRSVALTETSSQVLYSPQLTEETTLSLVLLTLILTVTTNFWWKNVIPQQRTNLARAKRTGPLRDYLETLKTEEEVGEKTNSKAFEKWLFADWLSDDKMQKDPALPFIRKVKWNSGDNPILVAVAAIMCCVLAASIGERIIPS